MVGFQILPGNTLRWERSHIPFSKKGTFESMIIRTSRLVGYVIVPWRVAHVLQSLYMELPFAFGRSWDPSQATKFDPASVRESPLRSGTKTSGLLGFLTTSCFSSLTWAMNLCSSKMGWGYGIPTYFHLISLISMKSMNCPSADLPDLLQKVIGAAWSVSWDVIVRGSQHGISGGGDFCFTNSRNKNQT